MVAKLIYKLCLCESSVLSYRRVFPPSVSSFLLFTQPISVFAAPFLSPQLVTPPCLFLFLFMVILLTFLTLLLILTVSPLVCVAFNFASLPRHSVQFVCSLVMLCVFMSSVSLCLLLCRSLILCGFVFSANSVFPSFLVSGSQYLVSSCLEFGVFFVCISFEPFISSVSKRCT